MYDFHVNQEVVCIEDSVYIPGSSCCKKWIKKDEIYTIRWVGLYDFINAKNYLAIKLHGVSRNFINEFSEEKVCDFPFGADRFRPLIKVEDFMKNVDIKELENV